MENKNQRKRRALLMMPVIVIPLLTLAFWILGGGKSDAENKVHDSGLNLQLPVAHLKDDKGENKLSYYEEADKDSVKFNEGIKKDLLKDTGFFKETAGTNFNYSSPKIQDYKDANEEKVYQKLAQLKEQLNTNPVKHKEIKNTANDNKGDIGPINQTTERMNENINADDPELNKLNGMMEKILDIQHPTRVEQRLKEKTIEKKDGVLPVTKIDNLSVVSLLDSAGKIQTSDGFFGLEPENNLTQQNAIEAAVDEDQALVNGAIIRLRLLSDILINGNNIPKNNSVYGMVSLNGERLQIEISSIRFENSIFPVKLEVYDLDGLPGIYIPGAMPRDVTKLSLDKATQMMEITSLDPSLKAQATTAGIDAVKTLLSKKAKLIKVTVKANYKVLLK